MSKTTEETKLTQDCIDYLKILVSQNQPIYWEHRSGQGGFNYKKGLPDLFLVINGRHIEVEFKTKTGQLSTLQEKTKYKFEKLHIPYLCCRSIEQFEHFVEVFIQN